MNDSANCGLDREYRDGLKGGPSIAINFSLILPGFCLAKQVHLLAHLCRWLTQNSFLRQLVKRLTE